MISYYNFDLAPSALRARMVLILCRVLFVQKSFYIYNFVMILGNIYFLLVMAFEGYCMVTCSALIGG